MSMVDWELAVSIGGRVAGNGPVVTAEEAQAAVEELRGAADRSTGLVREFTGLSAGERTAPVLVDSAGTVADAFALPAFPYFVFVNADGTVAGRLTGEVPIEDLDAIADQLAATR